MIDDLQGTVAPALRFTWILFFAFGLPLLVLAIWKRVYPTVLMALLLIAPLLASILLVFAPPMIAVVLIADIGIVLAALLDVWTLPHRDRFEVERVVQRVASLNAPQGVTLTIANLSRRPWLLTIKDALPQELRADPQQFELQLPATSRAKLKYEFRAMRRGAFTLEQVHVRATSRFQLWCRHLRYPQVNEIHVYPDMLQLSEYELLARTNRLSLMGVRRTRKIGQDNEFERLRDFTRDDNYKFIDWRSTARRNKLTVKDFQTNQSQRLLFLVDCGRMMTNEASGLSLLDHSLNAILMLSFVALKQGDSVGLLAFADRIRTYVPPRGGMSQMNHLLHASFDQFPDLVESRYDQAFLYLDTHVKKRSLVILISNIIDEVNAFQLQQYLGNLVGRHLPLGVLLRDHQIFNEAERVRPTGKSLYTAAAAAEILNWRRDVLRDLQHQGVLSMDVFPEDMTAPLVNRYLEIKARHLL